MIKWNQIDKKYYKHNECLVHVFGKEIASDNQGHVIT